METTVTSDKTPRYVLVVDDNVDDRFQAGMLLQQFGYRICTSASTRDAIDIMHVAPPVVIISEAIAGAGLVSLMQKDGRFSGIPVILLTAMRNPGLENRVRNGEFVACLVKPPEVDQFFKAVQAAVEKTPRKNIRVETCLAATREDEENGEHGCVTVLSEYGMFYQTMDPLPPNTRVPLSLRLRDRVIRLVANVVYSCDLESSPFRVPGMGMKIVEISPTDQAFIKNYILEKVQGGK